MDNFKFDKTKKNINVTETFTFREKNTEDYIDDLRAIIKNLEETKRQIVNTTLILMIGLGMSIISFVLAR